MKWSDLGLGWKLTAAVAPGLLLFAVVAGWTVRDIADLKQDVTEVFATRALQSSLRQGEIDHLKWAQAVSAYVYGEAGAKLAVQLDPHKCNFGTWYYGEQRAKATAKFPELKEPLERIEAAHTKLHESAEGIAKLKESGQAAEAGRLFATVSMEQLKIVQDLLLDMRKILVAKVEAQGQELLGQMDRERLLIIVAALAAICFGALVGVLVIRSVLRPVRATVAYAQAVQAGRPDAVLDIRQSDETGVLASAIGEMVAGLRTQMDFSQGVMRGVAVPFSVFSAQDTTLFTNQAMLDLMEIPGKPEDHLGKQSGEYIFGEKGRETLSTRALRERKSLAAEVSVTTRGGKTRHVRVSSAPFFDSRGEALGTVSLWLDQTEAVEARRAAESKTESITAAAARLEQVVEGMSSASEELSAQVEQSSRGTEVQAGRVAETATAMEEMNATVLEVARNASQASDSSTAAREKALDGARIVHDVVQGISSLQSVSASMREDMGALGKQAEGIGAIMNVISDIADQTNLLALNAAIEAARAGDAGRGFAVVADEVRKLAEKTMAATREVGDAIGAVQDGTRKNLENVERAVQGINQATGLANQGGQALQEIVHLVEVATDQVRSIAAASEQQSAASDEINRSLEDINRVSRETAMAMHQSAQAVGDLAGQAESLRQLIANMRQG